MPKDVDIPIPTDIEAQPEEPLALFTRLMREHGLVVVPAVLSPSGVQMPVGDFLPERFRAIVAVSKA